MSDMKDLIHKTSIDCLERGRREERERIIKLLEDSCSCVEECYCSLNHAIALIKGETE